MARIAPPFALPVTVSVPSSTATIDAAAVAAAPTADVTFAYAGGATDAKLRGCTALVVTVADELGRLLTPESLAVTPVMLADVIAQQRTATVHYAAPDLVVDSVAPSPLPPAGRAWVTADAILQQTGAYADPSTATPDDRAWADACAAAVNQGLDVRLTGVPVFDTADYPELEWSALTAGVEAYKRREAAFGLTGYVDLQGAAIRVARDYLEAIAPLIARYATVGIA